MRDLEALAREGLAKDMEHLNTADVRELVKVIHTTGEYDAVIKAYSIGVAMGYNQAKRDLA